MHAFMVLLSGIDRVEWVINGLCSDMDFRPGNRRGELAKSVLS
jgi:hypothetical protein